MKAILIDPRKHTYTEIDLGKGLQPMYEHLSDLENGLKVNCVERVHLRDDNWLWVDEEAKLKGPTKDGKMYAFPLHTTQQTIVGKALVIGTSESGEENASTTMTIEEVRYLTGDKLFSDKTDSIN